MEKRSDKVILIGIGSICRSAHIPCLKQRGVKVSSGVDINKESLRYFKKQFPRSNQFSSLAMIPSEVSMAIVSSPVNLHYLHVKTLLNRGINVLCEKPLGRNYEESKYLVNLAKKNKRILQVGYYRRFHETNQWIEKVINERTFGLLKKCEMFGGHNFKANIYPSSIFNKDVSGGGVLIDFGCHLIDRLYNWFGEIEVIKYQDDNCGGIESNCVVDLIVRDRKDKIPVRILLSRTNDLGYYTLLYFEREIVRIDHEIGHQISLGVLHDKKIILTTTKTIQDYFVLQWDEFLSQIVGNKQLTSNLEDSVKVSRLIDECYLHRKKLIFNWEGILKKYI